MCMCEMFPLCVGSQEHPSWCWQQAQASLWPLSKRMATATRRPQDTVNQQLSQASAMACKDPSSLSPLTGWSFHPSIHPPQSFTTPLPSRSAFNRERTATNSSSSFFCFLNLSLPPLNCHEGLSFFLLSNERFESQRINFLTFRIDYINFSYVYFIWMGNGLCTMGGLVCGKSWSSPKKKKREPHKHTKVCCEASGLHSVVRRNNVEPLPFDVREQLLLSDCKMHLIIVYSDTWPLLPSPQSWNTTLSH